ncbi:MAG TPA: M14 family metallopeptidase [Rhizomicrobium sp.]|jgi:predicted deacylase
MDPETHFPADYRSARHAFLTASDRLDVTTRVHPEARGPDGKPLFMDVAEIGARKAKAALLLMSATHGAEGYFGSGVETGLLREGALVPPKGSKIVVLHAVNPYGFAWDRRVNEDNADINRNFVDFANPPKNEAYAQLAEWVAPKDISREAIREANAHLRAFSDMHGAFALQTAISAGQYTHPDGVYFGGSKESWSSRMLRDVLKEHLRGVKELIVIDFHTGLGEAGAAEMITEDLPGSPAYERQKAIWGARVKSSEAGESLSAPLTGTIDTAFARWLPKVELTFAALECGTRPTRDVFNALRKDNWLHQIAGNTNNADADAIRRETRDAFYVDTPEWKRRVWAHGAEVVQQALNAMG